MDVVCGGQSHHYYTIFCLLQFHVFVCNGGVYQPPVFNWANNNTRTVMMDIASCLVMVDVTRTKRGKAGINTHHKNTNTKEHTPKNVGTISRKKKKLNPKNH